MGFLKFILFISPPLGAVIWSCRFAIAAYFATLTFKPIYYTQSQWESRSNVTNFSKHLQTHFRKYKIYLPFEDIVKKPQKGLLLEKIFLDLERDCGHGNVYVWVPLFFKVPLLGNKVVEWCWIPRIIIKKE